MTGYIKLHRKIKSWEWYRDPNTFRVFMEILLRANYKDTRYKGQVIQRGSFATTLDDLGHDLGLSRQQTKTAIGRLKSTHEIDTQATNKYTVIKVLNYNVYQGLDDDEQPTNEPTNNQQITNEQPTTDPTSNQPIEEELKNLRTKELKDSSLQHGRNKEFEKDSDEMKLAHLLADRMRLNNPACRLPSNFQEWCRHFDLMIRRDGRTPKEIQDVIIFSQSNPFWLSNILSARKLREKYDQLTLKMKEGGAKGGERPRRFVN